MTAYTDQCEVVRAELEKLHKIRAEAGGEDDPAVITHWVAFLATSYFTDDGEPVFGTYYYGGLETPLTMSVGLCEVGREAMLTDAGFRGSSNDD